MQLTYPYGSPITSATLKATPEDFIVKETLPFTPRGDGDHIYLRIQKTNLNTEEVASGLAKFARIPFKFVSYAGLKDKEAITEQWFSIKTNKTIDFTALESDQLSILESTRHNKKLKRGAVKQNAFYIHLKLDATDKDKIIDRLEQIKKFGFANYFGPQRFGHDGNNLKLAESCIKTKTVIQKRQLRSRVFSTIRSFLFNKILEQRIQNNAWLKPLVGDKLMFHDNHSVFDCKDETEIVAIATRIGSGDIHPSGPLLGTVNELETNAEAKQVENKILNNYQDWHNYLVDNKLELSRRAFRAHAYELAYHFDTANTLCLTFKLNAGSYATSMLSHCFDLITKE